MPRMGGWRRVSCTRTRCFNGASASMPRMVVRRANTRVELLASTGPRHRCRGWASIVVDTGVASVELQRGLGIDAEDGPGVEMAAVSYLEASTGPRHRCRGWERGDLKFTRARAQLQRGLGIDAEDGTRTRQRRTTCRSCFNGASASMPRMGAIAGSEQYGVTSLQRGLGIDAEDGRGSARTKAPASCASTGPRHRCRGWLARCFSASRRRLASTGPRHRCRGWENDWPPVEDGSARLQRGLGIDAEDGLCLACDHHGFIRASTGPRHRCRGWRACRRACRGLTSTLQRGLGIDAEDGGNWADNGHAEVSASTGPRHRCRGWGWCGSRTGRGASCFNGASASMPRMAAGKTMLAPPGQSASTGPRHRCRGWRLR